MAFCRQCGSPVGEVKFCSKCGAAVVGAPGAALAPPAPPPVPTIPSQAAPPASAAPQPVPAPGSSLLVRVLVAFLVFILLVILAVMGSCVYIGYRAKKKADEIQQAYKTNDLNKLAGALGVGSTKHHGGSSRESSSDASSDSGAGSSGSAPLSFPAWTQSAAGSESGSKVPLRPGLTVVTAIAQFGGDYESIKQIQQVTPTGVRLSYRADNVPNPLEGLQKLSGDKAPKASGSVTGSRTVRAQDLQNAHDYMQWFGPNQPEVMPGSTAISVSRDVLAELKGRGETQLSFRIGGLKGMAGSLLGALGQMAGGGAPGAPKETKDLADMGKADCTMRRVGAGLTAFPVLLNNQRISLPAIHAECTTDDGVNDFYFLDDPDNPLALAWKLAGSDTLQLVKISYPPQSLPAQPGAQNAGALGAPGGAGVGGGGGGGQQIEQELKQKGQAEVYGIYFDFASDKIKPESEPVLRAIADALNHNPTWKLRVEGHTDNIGGEEYNMNLSQRRAEAVKLALVTRYHIVADRLTPQGFGATRPKESNDALAGRARNRRVELVRQ
jgi:outer membrane protein OmpA-like peptidoglycan-associated protein